MMKIRARQLKKIIREEMGYRSLRERVDPSSFKVTGDEFEVMATADRPEETPGEETIRGKIVPYKGKFLPKADPENLPFGYESTRSVSGQLSSQLRDTITDLLGAATDVPNEERATKGKIIADALISLSDKYPDDEDVAAAIATILSVNMGFDVPTPGDVFDGPPETADIAEEEVMAEVRKMVYRGMRR
jgi:hypothetical protein